MAPKDHVFGVLCLLLHLFSSYQICCYFLQLCLFLTALCASHPDLLISGCELEKQISKFIMCLKKKKEGTQRSELSVWALAL